MRQEIAGAAGLLAFAILYLIGANGIQQSTLSDEVGARGLPFLLGVLLAIVAVGIMARAAFASGAATGDDEEAGSTLPRVLGLLGCAALFVVVAWLAGYVIACAITLLAVMVYEGGALDKRAIAIAVGGAFVFWVTFVYFLGVAQPVGKLFGG